MYSFLAIQKKGISIKSILEVYGSNDLQKTDVLKMGLKLVKILEKLHDAGVVHCDIKPDNILFGDISDLLTGFSEFEQSDSEDE